MEKGLELLVRASRGCLEDAGCPPDQVGHVIFVSTTGLSTPSLDSHLINELGLPRNTTRLPVWGLGCAAGAAGIARAFDYCLAHPDARVLLAALETCSLNFAEEDLSKKNLVAMSLFPDSYRIMGWDVVEKGFRLVLSPKLPELIRAELRPLVDAFLISRDLTRSDISHYLTHPGGARVLDSIREALGLSNGGLRLSEEVLRDFGNVSSVSVLIVLERWMDDEGERTPGYGLLSSFGPGFSAELLLLHA
jgi:alkylresorcinol/alkylpyrone synthase